jgi:hypothetical protein
MQRRAAEGSGPKGTASMGNGDRARSQPAFVLRAAPWRAGALS